MTELKNYKTSDLIQEIAMRIGKEKENQIFNLDSGDIVMQIPRKGKYKEVLEDTEKRITTIFFDFDFILELKVKEEKI